MQALQCRTLVEVLHKATEVQMLDPVIWPDP